MRARFERSEAVCESFGGEPKVVLGEDYEWLQLTYTELRAAPDGDRLAYYDTDMGVWWFRNEAYSDIVIVNQPTIVEEGSYAVTATLRTTMEFSPIERGSPLTEQDAIENARGTVSETFWGALEDEGWSVEFIATRL